MIDYIEKAKAFAMMAHKGQTDKAGKDYFTAHVAVVADGVEPDPLVKAAAYLHDTVEDTGTTIDTIRAEFPQEVAEAVSVLTRKKDMTYAEYIWRVKQNDIAVKVKRADLVSNMDLNRIPYPLTSKDLAREAKYLRAYKVLAPLDMQRTDYEQRLRDALETLCFFEAAPMCDILGTLLYWTPAPAESKS